MAGTIDIGAAALINQVSPALILQGIASGVLGIYSYTGGASTVALGLVLQLTMSALIAGIYALAAKRAAVLLRRPVVFGLAYGVIVFLVMNLIVVPLSRFGPMPAHVTLTWVALNVVAMLIFGVIVATLVSALERNSFRPFISANSGHVAKHCCPCSNAAANDGGSID